MSLALEARQFLRSTHNGLLSTFSAKFSGFPYGSITPFVLDQNCQPIILISTLAEHTKNIIANPKVSLLVFEAGDDLQANARLTLIGEAKEIDKNDTDLNARYLRYLPQAASYFEMHDFNFYRINITQARYIAGFGKMGWMEGNEIAAISNTALAAQEAGIIEHMNADHIESMLAYCQHYHGIAAQTAQMLGMDCDGFDVNVTLNDQSSQIKRFDFEQAITNAEEARMALVAMSKAVRHAQTHE